MEPKHGFLEPSTPGFEGTQAWVPRTQACMLCTLLSLSPPLIDVSIKSSSLVFCLFAEKVGWKIREIADSVKTFACFAVSDSGAELIDAVLDVVRKEAENYDLS
ncbi:hypothetical protein SLEP1_g44924 [Rubroshorea leprosula]|uniref:Uncharacterized protein n=1 Tax=Rubroshorea leprosula TaxID=152421 RepID=A0AAV5LHK5_9ROSI|nr:hypothetical protein SLEP1_g44924 [Rubroshorea leprosula]